MTTPWAPTNYSSAPVVKVPDAPARQIDFKCGMEEVDASTDTTPHHDGDICRVKYEYSLPNGTGGPNPNTDIELDDFRAVIDWVLNYNASKILPPTSIASQFWDGQGQLESVYWLPELTQTFESLLAFPLWAFHVNNFGNVNLEVQTISDSLPPEFYTNASLAILRLQIVISTTMFIVFVLLQGVLHMFIWAVLVWLLVMRPHLPKITSYPLLDFALKTRYDLVGRKPGAGLQGRGRMSEEILGAGDRGLLSAMGKHGCFISDESQSLDRFNSREGRVDDVKYTSEGAP